jgi:hypothetical protein
LKSGVRRRWQQQKLEERGGDGGEEVIWQRRLRVQLQRLQIQQQLIASSVKTAVAWERTDPTAAGEGGGAWLWTRGARMRERMEVRGSCEGVWVVAV